MLLMFLLQWRDMMANEQNVPRMHNECEESGNKSSKTAKKYTKEHAK